MVSTREGGTLSLACWPRAPASLAGSTLTRTRWVFLSLHPLPPLPSRLPVSQMVQLYLYEVGIRHNR